MRNGWAVILQLIILFIFLQLSDYQKQSPEAGLRHKAQWLSMSHQDQLNLDAAVANETFQVSSPSQPAVLSRRPSAWCGLGQWHTCTLTAAKHYEWCALSLFHCQWMDKRATNFIFIPRHLNSNYWLIILLWAWRDDGQGLHLCNCRQRFCIMVATMDIHTVCGVNPFSARVGPIVSTDETDTTHCQSILCLLYVYRYAVHVIQ